MARAKVGRRLVAAAVLGSGFGHAAADLDRTHVFNPGWLPHARFHAASAVATEAGWSAEDEPGQVPRVAGVPVNLLVAGVRSGLAAFGYLLTRIGDPASR
jgi:hypothetical protein